MKNFSSVKTIILGFTGALMAILIFVGYESSENTSQEVLLSDSVINGNQNIPVYRTSFTGLTSTDFKEASKKTINSVVHVTTKVVQTTFQRDIFQEFFYGPGAGGKEYKQFGA